MTKVYKVHIVPIIVKPKPATPDYYELNQAKAIMPFLRPDWNKK